MDIVNIYGHILDKSDIIIAIGNFNSIHGVLTYIDKKLEIKHISDIRSYNILQLIITYESPSYIKNNYVGVNEIYFTLKVKGINKYINIEIVNNNDKLTAKPIISDSKAYFTTKFSSIDNIKRHQLLAGSLYNLETVLGEQKYIVNWPVSGFMDGDVVIMIPTKWYEKDDNNQCLYKSDIDELLSSLNKSYFKGYSEKHWCQQFDYVYNCSSQNTCGDCLGKCSNSNYICVPNPNHNINNHSSFVCTDLYKEKSTELNENFNQTFSFKSNNTITTCIIILIIIILFSVLFWGIYNRKKYNS